MALWLWWVIVAPGVTVGMRGACTMRSEGELVYEEVCAVQCVWLKYDSSLTVSETPNDGRPCERPVGLTVVALVPPSSCAHC